MGQKSSFTMIKKTLAKDLTDRQKEEFTELFYNFADKAGLDIDDQDTPCPWGCPWYFGEDILLIGDTISEMVENFITENLDEIKELLNEDIEMSNQQ